MSGGSADIEDDAGAWSVSLAGAFAGIAAGAFIVSLFAHLYQTRGIFLGNYEPLAAFAGAFGLWAVAPGRGFRYGLLGVAAALCAMLLADILWIRASCVYTAWTDRVFRDWPDTLGSLLNSFRFRDWPHFLRYFFGLYIGWHLCFAGRASESAREPGGEDV